MNVTPFTTLSLSALVNNQSSNAYNSYPNNPTPTSLGSESNFESAAQEVSEKLSSVLDISSLNLLNQEFSPTAGDSYDDLLEDLKEYLIEQIISFESFVGYFVQENSETILKCSEGQHLNPSLLVCESNIQSCDINNGEGERNWSVSGWGNCLRVSCDNGYLADQNNACVSEGEPEEPVSSNEEEYQTVSLIESDFNQMASNQLEKKIGEGTVLVSKVGAGVPGPQSAYVFESTGYSPLKIKLTSDGEYIDLNSDSIVRYGDRFVFYVDKLYVAEGRDAIATAIDNKVRMNYVHATFRSGDKLFMILEDNNPSNGNQLENYMFELDLTSPTLTLNKINGLSSSFLNPAPKFIGVDDQGKILFEKPTTVNGAASEIQFHSFNPQTKSLELLSSYSTASATRVFRYPSQSFYLDGRERGFVNVDGRFMRTVEIKNGSTWEPKMIVLGRGESKVFTLKNQNISQVRLVNNKKIAYKTSFYNQQSEIMEAVALFSPDTGESIPWSQKTSSFTFTPTFIMKSTLIQGMVSAKQSLYVFVKEDTSENSVTTSRNEIIKIDNEGVASVLFSDLSSNVKNILNTSPSGQSIHFGTMAYLKGGIVMTTYGGSDSAILYRLRLDNGEMEVIKNDFYYNTYDGKSVNWMFKLNYLNKIIIGGEDSTTNGIYTKMFILE